MCRRELPVERRHYERGHEARTSQFRNRWDLRLRESPIQNYHLAVTDRLNHNCSSPRKAEKQHTDRKHTAAATAPTLDTPSHLSPFPLNLAFLSCPTFVPDQMAQRGLKRAAAVNP